LSDYGNFCNDPNGLWSGTAAPDDDYDEMTVAELDGVIADWGLEIPKSLNKAEKIAALRASDAEE